MDVEDAILGSFKGTMSEVSWGEWEGNTTRYLSHDSKIQG